MLSGRWPLALGLYEIRFLEAKWTVPGLEYKHVSNGLRTEDVRLRVDTGKSYL
jgi:hypothetical protein